MINLFDNYDQSSWDLHYSLLKSGYNHTTIVLNDDGFLPEDVTSPYLYFTGYDNSQPQTPLYFNQLEVPNLWEIKADNISGGVWDYDMKRANIIFASPSHRRWIRAVDWMDRSGIIRVSDCYNKFGKRYIQKTFGTDGRMLTTTYYDAHGKEIIVENHLTQNVLLTLQDGKVKIFRNTVDFIIFYLKHSNQKLDRIFYNTLGRSFLVAYYLNIPGNDILFWNEAIQQELPGNMTLLLKHPTRSTKIFVQDKKVYQQMQPLLTETSTKQVEFLGFLYPIRRQNHGRKEVLILTNSDQIQHLDYLVHQFPQLHFHIGALTEMSSKLLTFGERSNVTLYQHIPMDQVRELYKQCDFYLDINHGNEILSAIRTAFENNLLILGFEETVHDRRYIAPNFIYPSHDFQRLQTDLIGILQHPSHLEAALQKQRTRSAMSSIEEYQKRIG